MLKNIFQIQCLLFLLRRKHQIAYAKPTRLVRTTINKVCIWLFSVYYGLRLIKCCPEICSQFKITLLHRFECLCQRDKVKSHRFQVIYKTTVPFIRYLRISIVFPNNTTGNTVFFSSLTTLFHSPFSLIPCHIQ